MLFLAHWLVIFVLGFYLLQLTRKDGIKLPATIGTLWLLGYVAFPRLGLEGGLYFITYGAVLALVLIYVDLTREKMGYRTARPDPLAEQQHDPDTEQD